MKKTEKINKRIENAIKAFIPEDTIMVRRGDILYTICPISENPFKGAQVVKLKKIRWRFPIRQEIGMALERLAKRIMHEDIFTKGHKHLGRVEDEQQS